MNKTEPALPPADKFSPDSVERALLEKSEKIYPREVHGVFASLRLVTALGLLGIFYLVPWLNWNGHQALLFDLPARKFHIFGLTLWPQDFLYLAFLLMLAAYALFFFTALAGRLWCGYACPQTVWTESFLWIERLIEGSRNQQIRRDKGPWTAEKIRVKVTKHALWIAFAVFTGFTFVGYFTPIRDLLSGLIRFELSGWEWFWMLFYGFATYGNAGWMREQVCKYMCPYARFQSAMFDHDTLVISYDQTRGEPRGSRRASSDHRAQGLGDCINCTMCVQVCPTGIDIRNGLQYECIGCSACIDVCNDVMSKMGYAPSLIRYTTQRAMEGGETKVLRPRILIYAFIMACLGGLFLFLLANRTPVGLDVIRDRNQLYRESRGLIENVYTLKVINQTDKAQRYSLSVKGLADVEVVIDREQLLAEGGTVLTIPVVLRTPEDVLTKRVSDVLFSITADDDAMLRTTAAAKFIGPLP